MKSWMGITERVFPDCPFNYQTPITESAFRLSNKPGYMRNVTTINPHLSDHRWTPVSRAPGANGLAIDS